MVVVSLVSNFRWWSGGRSGGESNGGREAACVGNKIPPRYFWRWCDVVVVWHGVAWRGVAWHVKEGLVEVVGCGLGLLREHDDASTLTGRLLRITNVSGGVGRQGLLPAHT